MGYTTKFTGAIALSRPLTISEAKELLEIREAEGDDPNGPQIDGKGQYLQWVPTETLDAIVWDEGEKFYNYFECLQWLASWLMSHGVIGSGEIFWRGEDMDDVGTLTVRSQIVTQEAGRVRATRSGRPLTLEKLGAMALEQLTKKASE